MKEIIRKILLFLHLDITKNLEYDRLTLEIFKKHLRSDSNCIDVGCHKGEILDEVLKLSPNGNHFAFEPIPDFYQELEKKYRNKVTLYNCALANESGETTFNYVRNAPAYSGIKKRKYAIANPDIEQIQVRLEKLDELIPKDQKIDLIKIDVEGAELGVLQGGKKLIEKNKPLVLFEFGIGASDFYGTRPEDIFSFFEDCGMKIYTLKGFIQSKNSLSLEAFRETYLSNQDYYFVGK